MKHNTGFTLLEILISLSIAGIMGILLAQVFFTTARTNGKAEVLKDVKQNGEFALGIMERMVRNALEVNSSCLSGGATLQSIEIHNPDGGTTTFGCIVDNSVTRIASISADGQTQFLTSRNVTIGGNSCSDADNSLSFVCSPVVDAPSNVTVSFILTEAKNSTSETESARASFKTTVAPRN